MTAEHRVDARVCWTDDYTTHRGTVTELLVRVRWDDGLVGTFPLADAPDVEEEERP